MQTNKKVDNWLYLPLANPNWIRGMRKFSIFIQLIRCERFDFSPWWITHQHKNGDKWLEVFKRLYLHCYAVSDTVFINDHQSNAKTNGDGFTLISKAGSRDREYYFNTHKTLSFPWLSASIRIEIDIHLFYHDCGENVNVLCWQNVKVLINFKRFVFV